MFFKNGVSDFLTHLNAFVEEYKAKYQILVRYFDPRNSTFMLFFRNVENR